MMACSSTVRSAPQGTVQAIHLYRWINPASSRANFSHLSCPKKTVYKRQQFFYALVPSIMKTVIIIT
jgi:hypothetical protein